MVSKRGVALAAAAFLVLSLFAGVATSGQDCRKVTATFKFHSEFWMDPEICDGYDFCQYSEIRGTLKGRWWVFGNWEDVEEVAGGTAAAFNIVSIIETNRGTLYTESRELVNYLAADGFVAHEAVTGGTGKYEGATGWLAAWLSFDPAGGNIGGQICTPDGNG